MESNRMEANDKVFVFIALILGFLLFEFILFEGFGVSLPVYVLLFYAAVYWYFRGRPGGIDKKGLILLVPIGLLSACYALYDNMALSMLNFLLLFVLMLLQLATMSGARLYKTFSLGLAADLLHLGVVLPVSNLPAPFRALKRKSPGKAGPGVYVLIGLVVSLPLLAIVLGLLSSADLIFEKSLSRIIEFINDHVAQYLFKLVFGAVAATLMYALLHALFHGKKIGMMKIKVDFDRARLLPEGVVITVLALLDAVYVLFIAVQLGYLLNAFSSILPASYTYAEYARRGFFELMGVSFINLCVLAVSMLFSRRSGKTALGLLKAFETALVLLTLFVMASAAAKMVMYMDAYGLTLMRVYVSWFMLLCAVFFCAMLVKLYVKKFALVRFCSVAFLVLYLALNFAGVDGRIAQYNIDRYEAGKSRAVDVKMFYDLSDSMIPRAAALLDSTDKTVAAQARELLEGRANILDDRRWQVFSAARGNARQALISRGITYKPADRMD